MTAEQFVAWRTKNNISSREIANALRVSRVAVTKWHHKGTRPRVDVALYALFPDAVD